MEMGSDSDAAENDMTLSGTVTRRSPGSVQGRADRSRVARRKIEYLHDRLICKECFTVTEMRTPRNLPIVHEPSCRIFQLQDEAAVPFLSLYSRLVTCLSVRSPGAPDLDIAIQRKSHFG